MRKASETAERGSVWRCPACDGTAFEPCFRRSAPVRETVDHQAVVPSSDLFGVTAGVLNRCVRCGHASLATSPSEEVFEGAYLEATDEVSVAEEEGQVATATRDLARIERWVRPGRLLDVGCWTGSYLVASRVRGWEPEGLEPSAWACARARERGCVVRHATLDQVTLPPNTYRAVVAADVIEHLLDPATALAAVRAALEPCGVLFLTLPDAGSPVARLLGRRWWSVLPMHVQYFTRRSMTTLLTRFGFRVEALSTHPKAFSVHYYAGRVASLTRLARALPALTKRTGFGRRVVAPDLRDRMAVIARRL